MPDKDMDARFRAKLEGFEAEPSAKVWTGISSELNNGKRRRLVPVWSIAASVALFIAAGIFFLPKTQIEQGTKHPKSEKLAVIAKKENSRVITAKPVIKAPAIAAPQQSNHIQLAYVKNHSAAKSMIAKNPQGKQAPAVQVGGQLEKAVIRQPELIAAVAVVEPKISTPAVPDVPLNLTPIATTPAVLASAATDNAVKSNRKHRSAFTLGDLINTVVATVDKRADKVIEFTDTDDDQSNITGINLGIIKLKKAKNSNQPQNQ